MSNWQFGQVTGKNFVKNQPWLYLHLLGLLSKRRTATKPRQSSKCQRNFPVSSSLSACLERIPVDVNAASPGEISFSVVGEFIWMRFCEGFCGWIVGGALPAITASVTIAEQTVLGSFGGQKIVNQF